MTWFANCSATIGTIYSDGSCTGAFCGRSWIALGRCPLSWAFASGTSVSPGRTAQWRRMRVCLTLHVRFACSSSLRQSTTSGGPRCVHTTLASAVDRWSCLWRVRCLAAHPREAIPGPLPIGRGGFEGRPPRRVLARVRRRLHVTPGCVQPAAGALRSPGPFRLSCTEQVTKAAIALIGIGTTRTAQLSARRLSVLLDDETGPAGASSACKGVRAPARLRGFGPGSRIAAHRRRRRRRRSVDVPGFANWRQGRVPRDSASCNPAACSRFRELAADVRGFMN